MPAPKDDTELRRKSQLVISDAAVYEVKCFPCRDEAICTLDKEEIRQAVYEAIDDFGLGPLGEAYKKEVADVIKNADDRTQVYFGLEKTLVGLGKKIGKKYQQELTETINTKIENYNQPVYIKV